MITVLVVAAYPSMRAGLSTLLGGELDIEVIGASASAEWADDAAIDDGAPDVLLVDVDSSHPDQAEQLAALFPDAAQVRLLDDPNGYRMQEIQEGRPSATLLKDADAEEIVAAIRAVAAGLIVLDPAVAVQAAARAGTFQREPDDFDERLTERESQVLQLLAQGLPNKTIAMELGISEHTAKFHVSSIMTKLNAASRTEAVALAARRGLLVL